MDAAIVDGALVRGDVEVADGAVTRIGLPAAGTGRLAAPGYVDLQVNGYDGIDLLGADRDGVLDVARALRAAGVAAWQPTLISSPEEVTVRACQAIAEARAHPDGRDIVGIHLEGPFLAPERLGTHPSEHRRDPDVALLGRLLDAGPVTAVTLAPELPGATELIDVLLGRGVVVSIGHTDADATYAHAAFDAGASTVTHLFNAMRRFTARDAGVAAVALARPDVVVQVIVDGHHLADDTVRLVWQAAAGRTVLVTDATAAAGVGDGDFRLGDVDVTVSGGAVRRADGTLAGSALTMADAVRNLVALDVPLVDAVAAATAVPARVLDRDDLGRTRVGDRARLVVLDETGTVHRVINDDDVIEAT
ncbi:MAG: N-acetylglucosamine-6-phosphate deacetylase [Nitriliruptor sp.]|uniref:N-acetylglucosamine-6-phosphate deacetylase n=1 Tax=Nitriliruptor sp. TaxID=2448056 RepID=UPI0034A0A143